MIEALTIVGNDSANDSGTSNPKMAVENFRSVMTSNGKENGENLLDHYVTEIIADSKLVHEEYIMIEDFAQYLMSKWFFKNMIIHQLNVTLTTLFTYCLINFSNSTSSSWLSSTAPRVFIHITWPLGLATNSTLVSYPASISILKAAHGASRYAIPAWFRSTIQAFKMAGKTCTPFE